MDKRPSENSVYSSLRDGSTPLNEATIEDLEKAVRAIPRIGSSSKDQTEYFSQILRDELKYRRQILREELAHERSLEDQKSREKMEKAMIFLTVALVIVGIAQVLASYFGRD